EGEHQPRRRPRGRSDVLPGVRRAAQPPGSSGRGRCLLRLFLLPMSPEGAWPWVVLLLLGAFHGLNPGMGWLFAVALGLQEQRRQAVFNAVLPIACGHAAAIGAVVLGVGALQIMLPEWMPSRLCAAVLIAFGVFRLYRARHPRWVGMRVGFNDLTLWSFLMASAHGAGLMLVPVLWQWPTAHATHAHLIQDLSPDGIARSPELLLLAVPGHTAGPPAAAPRAGVAVYEKLGLALLRRAWFNVDGLWAVALLIAGVVALVL